MRAIIHLYDDPPIILEDVDEVEFHYGRDALTIHSPDGLLAVAMDDIDRVEFKK